MTNMRRAGSNTVELDRNYTNTDFSKQEFKKKYYHLLDLSHADYRKADFKKSGMIFTKLASTDFTDAHMDTMSFIGCEFDANTKWPNNKKTCLLLIANTFDGHQIDQNYLKAHHLDHANVYTSASQLQTAVNKKQLSDEQMIHFLYAINTSLIVPKEITESEKKVGTEASKLLSHTKKNETELLMAQNILINALATKNNLLSACMQEGLNASTIERIIRKLEGKKNPEHSKAVDMLFGDREKISGPIKEEIAHIQKNKAKNTETLQVLKLYVDALKVQQPTLNAPLQVSPRK